MYVGLVLLMALVAAVLGGYVGGLDERDAGTFEPSSVAARTHQTRIARWLWVGVVVGVVLALTVASSGALGRGVLLAAPLFGLVVLIATVLAELSVASPTTTERRADLTTRRVVDYLPRRLTKAVGLGVVALSVIGVAASAFASPDDAGRPGRWLTVSCAPDTFQSRGPWPGAFYTGPMLVVALIGLALAAVTIHTLVKRPRIDDSGLTDLEVDDLLRRRSARRVVAAYGILIAVPLVGISTFAGIALAGFDCLPMMGVVARFGLMLTVPLAVALLGWSIRALLANSLPAGSRRARLR